MDIKFPQIGDRLIGGGAVTATKTSFDGLWVQVDNKPDWQAFSETMREAAAPLPDVSAKALTAWAEGEAFDRKKDFMQPALAKPES